MSGSDHLNPNQFAARRAARDAAVEEAKKRHPAGKGEIDSGEKLKAEYIKVRDSGVMQPVVDKIREEMTPAERKAAMKRRMRREGL